MRSGRRWREAGMPKCEVVLERALRSSVSPAHDQGSRIFPPSRSRRRPEAGDDGTRSVPQVARPGTRQGRVRPVRALLVEGLLGDVVEIGAGTGGMFPYYGDQVSVSAIGPDPTNRAAAQQEARARSATIQVLAGVAESLPFDDASIDAVVTSTVLCSVQSVQKTLAEFRRVLKPDADLRLLGSMCGATHGRTGF